MPRQDKPSSAELDATLKEKAKTAGMSPEELSRLTVFAEILRAPSALEQQKIDEDRKRTLDSLMEQASMENNAIANRLRYQQYCTHRKFDGKLGIGGQLIGPDDKKVAFVQCNNEYCKKTWMWTAMPEEITNGLCLNDDPVRPRFQTAEQLDYQEKALPVDPKFCQKVGHPEVGERHAKNQAVTA